MVFVLIAFGVFLLVAGITLILNPVIIFTLLRENEDKPGLHVAAVLARLVIGLLLIYLADDSKYPPAIEFLGWIFVIAAVVLAAIGRKRFMQLMSWVLSLAEPFGRVAGILAVGFGSFIIYAFI